MPRSHCTCGRGYSYAVFVSGLRDIWRVACASVLIGPYPFPCMVTEQVQAARTAYALCRRRGSIARARSYDRAHVSRDQVVPKGRLHASAVWLPRSSARLRFKWCWNAIPTAIPTVEHHTRACRSAPTGGSICPTTPPLPRAHAPLLALLPRSHVSASSLEVQNAVLSRDQLLQDDLRMCHSHSHSHGPWRVRLLYRS